MIEKYFKLAAEVAQLREDGRIFLLGCVAIRGGDQAVVLSSNSPVMIGNLGTNERTSFPPAHAEMKCAKKNEQALNCIYRKNKERYEKLCIGSSMSLLYEYVVGKERGKDILFN